MYFTKTALESLYNAQLRSQRILPEKRFQTLCKKILFDFFLVASILCVGSEISARLQQNLFLLNSLCKSFGIFLFVFRPTMRTLFFIFFFFNSLCKSFGNFFCFFVVENLNFAYFSQRILLQSFQIFLFELTEE